MEDPVASTLQSLWVNGSGFVAVVKQNSFLFVIVSVGLVSRSLRDFLSSHKFSGHMLPNIALDLQSLLPSLIQIPRSQTMGHVTIDPRVCQSKR